ncbi:response regulator [Flaviflagellibacter deserti]|uniref:histidine kinase n=1 Tax=Flaviflagellibacter deserti TaxID=2267266 RepID=A0ABV9YZU2_9HYPH
MSQGGESSEQVLILAPGGRDALVASSILRDAHIPGTICADIEGLCATLAKGAGAAVIAEEALLTADLGALAGWISDQPPWSDFPFLILALRGAGIERNPDAKRLTLALGNVSFLERPFHPTTLVTTIRSALRARRRQYEARERIEQIRRAESLLEDRVRERTAELEAANRQLATQINERQQIELALRQSQRLEAVGQLTSGVAHDFNNLLTVILGNVRQMQKAATEPKMVRRLTMMAEAAERGAKLTSQMLAFSRRQKLEPKPVDLNETVSSMRDLLQSTMGGSVRIETVLASNLWPALIDPTQIELVILNLAINARDAMAVGGALTVETANVSLGPPRRPEEPRSGDYVMVAVNDTGTGMSPEVIEKAFEPFFTTKEVGRGSGLGLSQVYGLAKQSGGGVKLDSRLGEGTSVKVYLPRSTSRAEATAARDEISIQAANELVLVVDDDSAVREVTASILRDLGYRVTEAGSGGAALEAIGTPDLDVVLLDFAMPGMNGAEVAAEIRSRRPDLPIVFATGYADAGALTEAPEDRIIHKPFVEQELNAKLRKAIGAGSSAGNVVRLQK